MLIVGGRRDATLHKFWNIKNGKQTPNINTKQRGAEKLSRIPIKIVATETLPRKPDWIRVKIPASPAVNDLKKLPGKIIW